MKRYKVTMTVTLDLGDERKPEEIAAIVRDRILDGSLSLPSASAFCKGWVFPDGSVQEYAPPPQGMQVEVKTSIYYGSHDERGEGDEEFIFALPEGVRMPETFALSHGSFSEQGRGREDVPEGVFLWDACGKRWVPFPDSDLYQEREWDG